MHLAQIEMVAVNTVRKWTLMPAEVAERTVAVFKGRGRAEKEEREEEQNMPPTNYSHMYVCM